ncbi:MAG: kelch repeat-containing protein [Phycisphaerae bacterium]|nr:kelch repeat-containing protein [Phycisphaerae bacterium]
MRHARRLVTIVSILLAAGVVFGKAPRKRPYRLPDVDIKSQVIWGSTCDGPEGKGLSFGGQDQNSDDGRPHTRVKSNNRWQAIHKKLRAANAFQKLHDHIAHAGYLQKRVTALARSIYFKDLRVGSALPAEQKQVVEKIASAIATLKAKRQLAPYEVQRGALALRRLISAQEAITKKLTAVTSATIRSMDRAVIDLEQAAEHLDAEPPARALSPLVYDARSKLYILFGGDHLDYLTNDTWVFDPAKHQWRRQHPATAPPPRANHKLIAAEGKITLTGGYTYSSNTDYCGGQYIDHDDGDWTYDIAANKWTGGKTACPGDRRVYRTGPFHPDFYLTTPPPDAAATARRLAGLKPNTWTAMNPPRLPRLNRDWGTAVIDPDHDLMLRFSGGHSAHGGSDVLHYHFATNCWELPFPVEFPLGQLYANTRYPNGYNFNHRPWVTGHTYQNYGYDPIGKKMVFAGRPRHYYLYDPQVGDWVRRGVKPSAMVYNSCFYTITVCTARDGAMAWTRSGSVLQFVPQTGRWGEFKLRGEKLPGAVVDNSTMVYDSKRNRLLFAMKGYGRKNAYDGQLHFLDVRTQTVGKLSPGGMAAAGAIPYLCQIRYDAGNDLFLVGGTLPPGKDGLRRTPAYDPAANKWISLAIGGKDPSGPKGRNVSLGMMYDKKRKLFWAVDTNSRVYVLRLAPGAADPKPLGKN